MAFDIEEIRAEIIDGGVVKPHDYRVIITPPRVLLGKQLRLMSGTEYTLSNESARTLTFRANSVRIPGVMSATTEVARYGIGPLQKMAYNTIFTDNTITFMEDVDGLVAAFFYAWQNEIMDFSERSDGGQSRRATYEMGYRENYETSVKIDLYEPGGQRINQFSMDFAFPNLIGDAQLGWGIHDQILVRTVGFTFRTWNMETLRMRSQNVQQNTPQENYPYNIDQPVVVSVKG